MVGNVGFAVEISVKSGIIHRSGVLTYFRFSATVFDFLAFSDDQNYWNVFSYVGCECVFVSDLSVMSLIFTHFLIYPPGKPIFSQDSVGVAQTMVTSDALEAIA